MAIRSNKFFAVLTAAAVSLSLAACGGKSASSEQSLPAEGQELSGDITMWSSFTQGPRAEWMQHMADKFMEKIQK
ncbi:hypothetical protein RQN30_08615 [Arcanobacterium hippocoleae]